MFRFENEIYLYFAAFAILIMLLYFYSAFRRKKAIAKFGNPQLVNSLIIDKSKYKSFVKMLLLVFAFLALVAGIANPQLGSKMEKVKREGIEVVIALDISNSMLADDIKPSRLERAKMSVMKLIDKLQGDKIGIVVFAGDSYLLFPLTADYSAAKMLISSVNTDFIQTQGTALGSALNTATVAFSENQKIGKAIILISDGENHEDDAISAAKDATEKGIKVFSIGMGTPDGSPIKIGSGATDFMRDEDGAIVVSKLDASMLTQVAKEGNGEFVYSSGTDSDLVSILEKLSKEQKAEFESRIFTDFDDKFQWAFALAFLILLFEFFLSEKRNKWLTSLSKFAEGKK